MIRKMLWRLGAVLLMAGSIVVGIAAPSSAASPAGARATVVAAFKDMGIPMVCLAAGYDQADATFYQDLTNFWNSVSGPHPNLWWAAQFAWKARNDAVDLWRGGEIPDWCGGEIATELWHKVTDQLLGG